MAGLVDGCGHRALDPARHDDNLLRDFLERHFELEDDLAATSASVELVQRAKDAQRSSKRAGTLWTDRCGAIPGGSKDPARHGREMLEDYLAAVEALSENLASNGAPGSKFAWGFAIGSVVEAHSLSTAFMNGRCGQVRGEEDDRVLVDFGGEDGVKAVKPVNLRLVDHEAAVDDPLRQAFQEQVDVVEDPAGRDMILSEDDDAAQALHEGAGEVDRGDELPGEDDIGDGGFPVDALMRLEHSSSMDGDAAHGALLETVEIIVQTDPEGYHAWFEYCCLEAPEESTDAADHPFEFLQGFLQRVRDDPQLPEALKVIASKADQGNGARVAEGGADDSHEFLIWQVKRMQHLKPEVRIAWQDYCKTFGKGTRDPGRHGTDYLLKFREEHPEAAAEAAAEAKARPELVSGHGQRKRRSDGGPVDKTSRRHEKLVDIVQRLNKSSKSNRTLWNDFICGRAHDPKAYSVNELQSFVDKAKAGCHNDRESQTDLTEKELLIIRLKEVQRAHQPVAGDEWNEYCDAEGGGIRKPSRHDADFIRRFLTEVWQGPEVMNLPPRGQRRPAEPKATKARQRCSRNPPAAAGSLAEEGGSDVKGEDHDDEDIADPWALLSDWC